uniref:NAD-dependent epimerase/dehydratase family protein n=1 Tax=Schlesneria paludicola TaxID=360056 RepID=A0A7C4QLC1_9PLAN
MSYYLLTGATGLLGNYLLRDLLLADELVAVIVRSSRRQSARQRIDGLLTDWEQQLGRTLPRPVVLEGDISEADLGLNACDVRWVAEHCSAVIHNAASLSFQATSREGEPYRSNEGGTRHVLELCRSLGIRELHHVSTAYIAGLRSGRVLETEADVGQELGNDYERSKLAAEQMVRAADYLRSRTVYRPGIIIGDSRTGFTTTYHGFYAALQLAHTIVKSLPCNESGLVGGHAVRLALNGNETKHLVPVDWVSAVMVHVIRHPEWHGRTYHLTPKHPVTARMIRDVLEAAVGFYGAKFAGADRRPEDCSEPESLFYEHIRVYNSYWRMDPEFDRTNTELAAPHLPCPHVDRNLLLRLSRIAIEQNFPTPSKKPLDLEFDAQDVIEPWLERGADVQARRKPPQILGLDVRGPGGGQWRLLFDRGQILAAEPGLLAGTGALCRLDTGTLAEVVRGRQSWTEAFAEGTVQVLGNGADTAQYAALLDQLSSVPVA